MNFASTDRTNRFATAAILLGLLGICSPRRRRPSRLGRRLEGRAGGRLDAVEGGTLPRRPTKVADDILEHEERVDGRGVGSAAAHNYHNQFDGGWTMLRPDEPFVGRALTVAYLPSRPISMSRSSPAARSRRVGRPNSWPIDMLQKGDVYVADGMGKIADGTLIGDNLGNAIYAKTGTGVVFNASARDPEGLEKIKGFNAFVRGWDPSEIKGVTLSSINRPIRIGRAVVLPGDVVLARKRRRDLHPRATGGRGRRDFRNRFAERRIRPHAAA